MKVNLLLLAGAVLVAGTGVEAQTAVPGATLLSPTFSNDFENIASDTSYLGATNGYPSFPTNTVYAQGGISISYVGSTNAGDIWNSYLYTGNYGWYADGGGFGYDSVKLTSGGLFGGFQFDAGSGAGGVTSVFFETLLNGVSVSTGLVGLVSRSLTTYSLVGGNYNEVRLQNPVNASQSIYSEGSYEALALDNLKATAATTTGAVPEPATWAMMVIGFGMVGFGMRYRRKSTAVSFG